MANFLPDNYEIPDSSSGYMKFEQGPNRFRVLSSAIVGNVYWKTVDDKRKPIRKRMNENIPVEDLGVNPETGEAEAPKHFWAFVVWNYNAEKVQILEITQKTIQRSIKALTQDEDWGDPKKYDIVVTREGEKFDTTYSVNPKPHKELDEGIIKFYEDLDINLEALYDGDDPFKSASTKQTDGYVEEAAKVLTKND